MFDCDPIWHEVRHGFFQFLENILPLLWRPRMNWVVTWFHSVERTNCWPHTLPQGKEARGRKERPIGSIQHPTNSLVSVTGWKQCSPKKRENLFHPNWPIDWGRWSEGNIPCLVTRLKLWPENGDKESEFYGLLTLITSFVLAVLKLN